MTSDELKKILVQIGINIRFLRHTQFYKQYDLRKFETYKRRSLRTPTSYGEEDEEEEEEDDGEYEDDDGDCGTTTSSKKRKGANYSNNGANEYGIDDGTDPMREIFGDDYEEDDGGGGGVRKWGGVAGGVVPGAGVAKPGGGGVTKPMDGGTGATKPKHGVAAENGGVSEKAADGKVGGGGGGVGKRGRKKKDVFAEMAEMGIEIPPSLSKKPKRGEEIGGGGGGVGEGAGAGGSNNVGITKAVSFSHDAGTKSGAGLRMTPPSKTPASKLQGKGGGPMLSLFGGEMQDGEDMTT